MPAKRKPVGKKNNNNLVYRSEWRVLSKFRPPRTESYDVSFTPGQAVHLHLSDKLEHAERKLKQHTLRFGESIELVKIYFISRG